MKIQGVAFALLVLSTVARAAFGDMVPLRFSGFVAVIEEGSAPRAISSLE